MNNDNDDAYKFRKVMEKIKETLIDGVERGELPQR